MNERWWAQPTLLLHRCVNHPVKQIVVAVECQDDSMMSHGRPQYDPPYDSPIENEFAWAIVKYLESTVSFEKQKSFTTICGVFRPDFVATTNTGYSVAYECDGIVHHDSGRDEWRDAMLLGDRQVDVVVRLRGCDINYHLEDCLYVCSLLDPQLHSDRGRRNLHVLASEEAKRVRSLDNGRITITYADQSVDKSNPLCAHIGRLT